MRVLVLGHNGMLGHMVVKYLQSQEMDVVKFIGRFPEDQKTLLEFKGDYIINCIGAIPQRTDNFDINWYLPIWLDTHAPCKVIHPGTDCEMDEDNYGISKRIAADYIRNHGRQTKSIKTSIIGPEPVENKSLLDWFLSQEGEVFGYTKAMWNGNTTLEWAKYCEHVMQAWNMIDPELIINSNCISKYELLCTIKKVFDKDIKINKKELGKDKCLIGTITTNPIVEQLEELKEYYYDN
jgi:dTDP-4-dehydrorhamnose reductase